MFRASITADTLIHRCTHCCQIGLANAVLYGTIAVTWLYSTLIGCIPLSADDTYTYLGSTRLRLCFIDFTASSGGSTFAALLLCAVVGPSLIAVFIFYC